VKTALYTYFLLFTFILINPYCKQMWGDKDLGNNFSLLEGDRIEDRVIGFCSGRSDGGCLSGIPIVPTYSRHFDQYGHYTEYVESAKSNDRLIIAKTKMVKEKRDNYWIILKDFTLNNCAHANCESIIKKHVLGPFDKTTFLRNVIHSDVGLSFND
jgi:hypothetical protein